MTSQSLTVASPPLTPDVAAQIMASMAAQSGVVTDYNSGSQIRTLAEALGSVVETQGVEATALALQAMVNAVFYVLGITPYPASAASGSLTFATSFQPNPPTVPQPVNIPAGTLVGTIGGVQFSTTTNAILNTGSVSVNVPIQATVAGVQGNVNSNSITQLISSLAYPLQVNNLSPTTGGAGAETTAQTLSRATAKVASFGLSSPVAIANACIGTINPGTAESVLFATVYEPWVANNSTVAGYDVYVDNGSGSASAGLLAAVTSLLNGNVVTGALGYRPAGVPYTVNAVSPVYGTVTVTGVTTSSSVIQQVQNAVTIAIQQYFQNLAFGQAVYASALTAVASNAAAGYLSQITVSLLSGGTSVASITALPYQRVILQSSSVLFSGPA